MNSEYQTPPPPQSLKTLATGKPTEINMGKKPVFGVSDKVRLKPAFSTTETIYC